MESKDVKKYFEGFNVVCDYARATKEVGLWESEKIVFGEWIKKDSLLLELGCGAGRIAIGLSGLGYSKITATDFSENMVDVARAVADDMGAVVNFGVEDACDLSFADESFDAVIFGFNGLMQIPRRERRQAAFAQIYRVLKRGGIFVFTTHDRTNPLRAYHWRDELLRWQNGTRDPRLQEFGDNLYEDDEGGTVFIHTPDDLEVSQDLSSAGFKLLYKAWRSEIAKEPTSVEDFSDNCVFRVVEKI